MRSADAEARFELILAQMKETAKRENEAMRENMGFRTEGQMKGAYKSSPSKSIMETH